MQTLPHPKSKRRNLPRSSRTSTSAQLRFESDGHNLAALLVIAVIFHGLLLPFTMSSTYDAYIHMFFGDHYSRSWFDPWEPRWYTGFSTTSYPPATHMIIALWNQILPLKGAFAMTMLMGIVTLVFGFYRFARIWARSGAFWASLLLIFSSGVV